MTNLNDYKQDGANKQARAVLCMLQGMSIEESWDKQFRCYTAEVQIGRWENCREQGYVAVLRSENNKQLNIAFFEHRNSDSICAVKWEQFTINSPTIDTAEFADVYKDKYDVSHSVGPGMITEMAEWIEKELQSFWLNNRKAKAACES